MYKIFFFNLIFFFLFLYPVIKTPILASPAQTDTEKVLVRAAKHDDFTRIVFTLSEESFKNVSVTTTNEKLVKVSFPSPVTLVLYQQGAERIIMRGEGFIEIIKGLKIIAGSHFCLLQIDKFDHFKLSRLNAPPRIVIDAYYKLDHLSKPVLPKPSLQQPEALLKKTFGSFVIDPGHGGYDKGIYDENNREKDITLNISKDMAQILSKGGKKVMLTRKADQRLSIKERIILANTIAHDIFLSIHISANDECIVYTYEHKADDAQVNGKNRISEDIAGSLINTLRKEFTFNIRQEKLPLPILKGVSAPALLIELPHFNHFSYDKKNIETLIKSIIKGLAVTPVN